ncbi:HesA/MoeB/ThiF family protein [Corynebacterium hansenii]|uniref:HesA/MoeB/ThiF family protein n=1 Tax=Corynebacterium hansenii TaxID=394964 RepID=A0ABV7ZNJ7_9CORY|nr:HesA/MoeB/ThiF family protein [Corynebacterium hansenii]WJY99199.1 putative adenylyltransferase/sulfurtransferase MoeZ [Corynebacterium hansenii]
MTEPAARPTPGPTRSAEAAFDPGRYARHLPIPGFGEEGQRRLAGARVLMVGAGGLGSPVGFYLAAVGVGKLTVVDDDRVDLTNLQRQVIHREADIGRPKVESAAEKMAALNPDIEVSAVDARLTADNVDGIIAGHDLVIDGTDNFDTRYLIADACRRLGVVEVWGSIRQLGGQVSVFGLDLGGGRRVWLRDLYPEPPAPETVLTAEQTGILGTVPGTIGTLMATEAVKVITGLGEPLSGRVLFYDSAAMSFREFRFAGDAGAVR